MKKITIAIVSLLFPFSVSAATIKCGIATAPVQSFDGADVDVSEGQKVELGTVGGKTVSISRPEGRPGVDIIIDANNVIQVIHGSTVPLSYSITKGQTGFKVECR